MIKTTLWTVGTCGCKIYYRWDSNEPEATRTHTYSRIEACSYHKLIEVSNIQEKCLIVAQENRKVGVARLSIEEATGGEIKAEDVSWEFDDVRNIRVKIPKDKIGKHKLHIMNKLSDLGIELKETDG